MQALNIQTINPNQITQDAQQGSSSIGRIGGSSFRDMIEQAAQDNTRSDKVKSTKKATKADLSEKNQNNNKKLAKKIKGDMSSESIRVESRFEEDLVPAENTQIIDFNVGNDDMSALESCLGVTTDVINNAYDINVTKDYFSSDFIDGDSISSEQVSYLMADAVSAGIPESFVSNDSLSVSQDLLASINTATNSIYDTDVLMHSFDSLMQEAENLLFEQDLDAELSVEDGLVVDNYDNLAEELPLGDGVLSENVISENKTERKSPFKITDFRTETSEVAETVSSPLLSSEKVDVELNKDIHIENLVDTEQGNVLDVSLTLNNVAQMDLTSVSDQSAAADGSAFQQMLSAQIQENAPEFVKAGNIVLRDNNNGTINMNLKPESLGNVKISLELSDKIITGQITVVSKEAYEAFRQNLDTIRQAFVENGFENATLNLNLADNSSNGFLSQNQSQNQNAGDEYMTRKSYSNYISDNGDGSVEQATVVYAGSAGHAIDVVA